MVDYPTWGAMKYADQTPVPLRSVQCESKSDSAHKCKQHSAHTAAHKCICGKTWPAGVKA